MKEKNVKHFTNTLAVVSLLMPISATALGIGELQLHSALNQSLNAEIRLLLAPGENPDDIKVKLAPPEKFDQAGVPWHFFLSKIHFQAIQQANGSLVIKVTSREPLTEPFLNFLLEVSWPQGSQFREFTALIDPPADYGAPVTASVYSKNHSVETYPDYDRPVRKPTRTVKKRIARTEQRSNITPQTPSSGEYGPVEANTTLWRIADELGSERNVSTKQMLTALFQANPHAFNNGNINSLKQGAVLKIPETDAIRQADGAHSEPRPSIAQKEKSTAARPASSGNPALELVAPSSESKAAEITKNEGPIKPGQDIAQTAGPSGTGTTTGGKDTELQSRIEKLEQQLNMMQELLALKDQQLATLQGHTKPAEPIAADKTKVETPATATTTDSATATATPSITETPPPAPTQVPAPTPQPETATTPPPAPAKPTPPKPAPVAPVEAEGDIFSSPYYNLVVGGLSVGLISLLGWLLWRKRKIESKTNTESMFASASQIKLPDSDSSLALPVMEMNSTGSYDVGTVGESSFISDFTPSDFEAFDTDQSEIDPLSEADVYLAYGRYQQAEDLIHQAIKEHPDKDEYKLKLLEIFYANENKARFADFAQELAKSGKSKDSAFWNKVTEMGKDIIPESLLFGGSGILSELSNAGFETEPGQEPGPELDAGLDFDSLNSDFIDLNDPAIPNVDNIDIDDFNPTDSEEWKADNPDEADNSSLDFDLSLFSENRAPAKTEASATLPPDLESIDFDFSPMEAAPAVKAEQPPSDISDTLESFDFNFDLEPQENRQNSGASTALPEETLDKIENFEFPAFEDSLLLDKSEPDALATSIEHPEKSDDFDFNFNFDSPNSLIHEDELDLGVSDLTDMDEFETKIDLAKAYIDMGDTEAAKNIIEEVLKKGSPEQQQTAQILLKDLS